MKVEDENAMNDVLQSILISNRCTVNHAMLQETAVVQCRSHLTFKHPGCMAFQVQNWVRRFLRCRTMQAHLRLTRDALGGVRWGAWDGVGCRRDPH